MRNSFPSTFEEEDEPYIPPNRGRTFAHDSRSRSQSLAPTRGLAVSPNQFGEIGTGRSIGYTREDVSNISPFVRVDEFYRDDGGGSGTTSRRHSVSVVQPRRGIVGFNAPEINADSTMSTRGLLLDDDDLAADLAMLNLTPSSQPVSTSPYRGDAHSFFANQTQSQQQFPYYSGSGYRARAYSGSQRLTPQQTQQGFFPTRRTSDATLPAALSNVGGLGHHTNPNTVLGVSPTSTNNAHLTTIGNVTNSLNELGKGLPLSSVPAHWPLFIVEFKAGRTDLFYLSDTELVDISVGDLVIVEADRGKDLGKVVNDSITVREVEEFVKNRPDEDKKDIHPKQIYGKAGPSEAQYVQCFYNILISGCLLRKCRTRSKH